MRAALEIAERFLQLREREHLVGDGLELVLADGEHHRLEAVAVSDQFLLGPAFLVSPVTQPGATRRDVVLPGGTAWFDFWSGERFDGGRTLNTAAPLETIPLFVRAGSIVPLGPVLQYTGEQTREPMELRVYPGADGAFTLYEDEGDGYNYEKGAFATIPISWNENDRTLDIGRRQGQFPGMVRERMFRIVLVRPEGNTSPAPAPIEMQYRGAPLKIHLPK